MPQRDYILRLIEQMGRALAELRRRILEGPVDPAEVRAELDRALQGVGLDAGLALRASPETLELMILGGGEVDPTRAWVLAEALYIQGLGAEAGGDPDTAHDAWIRALHLYELILPSATFYGLDEAEERRIDVLARLEALETG